MKVIDYLLDGLEAELKLERELGVRSVEVQVDTKAWLKTASTPALKAASAPKVASAPALKAVPTPTFEVVFLHHRALSPEGNAMLAKIIVALGLDDRRAPIKIELPLPKAKVYVVLGGLALRKFFPEERGEPGQWITAPDGTPLLVTYSPEYILRFKTVTPGVEQIKRSMWRALKGVTKRI